jgi:FHA domain-containing protein
MTETLRRLLDGRRSVMREFGIAGTQVEFGANPLKFAPTTEAAVEGLIRPIASGFITGEEAIADALSSMQSHQLALVGAIRSAVRAALDAFDPAELERKLESRGLSQAVPALRRAELWKRFCEEYARFAEQANDDILMVIGRELGTLYAASRNQPADRGRLGPLDAGDK